MFSNDQVHISFRAQKELVEKERKEEEESRKKRLGHADDVRAQIREKEHARIADRNAFFEEGVKLDEEARQRRVKLEGVKRKKLETLRWVMVFKLHIQWSNVVGFSGQFFAFLFVAFLFAFELLCVT